mmetsp:Transcript_22667/g.34252  ORF Transcript_22667/g.34252 Transcript_22667/m.34252 type:complete len:431 (-) Transcript_22667:213-1505(-)
MKLNFVGVLIVFSLSSVPKTVHAVHRQPSSISSLKPIAKITKHEKPLERLFTSISPNQSRDVTTEGGETINNHSDGNLEEKKAGYRKKIGRAALIISSMLVLSTSMTLRWRKSLSSLESSDEKNPVDSLVSSNKVHYHLVHFLLASESLLLLSNFALKFTKNFMESKIVEILIPPAILIGINAIITVYWQLSLRDGNRHVRMVEHFTRPTKDRNLRSQYPHTLLTSAFSHLDVKHFFSSALVIWWFAPSIVQQMGYRWFAYFYVGSIYGSEFFYEKLFRHILIDQHSVRLSPIDKIKNWFWKRGIFIFYEYPGFDITIERSMGASGAASAVIMYYALSGGSFLLSLFLVAQECFSLFLDKTGKTVYGVHFGGYLFGLLFFGLFSKGRVPSSEVSLLSLVDFLWVLYIGTCVIMLMEIVIERLNEDRTTNS